MQQSPIPAGASQGKENKVRHQDSSKEFTGTWDCHPVGSSLTCEVISCTNGQEVVSIRTRSASTRPSDANVHAPKEAITW